MNSIIDFYIKSQVYQKSITLSVLSLCHAHVINCVLFLHVSVSPFLSHFSITGLCFPVSLMNCVKEVHWVAVGTPLRGVSMTLSPGAGNNRRNQLLWESAWHSGGAVYKLASRLGQTPANITSPEGLSQRSPAALRTCGFPRPLSQALKVSTAARSPHDIMKFIWLNVWHFKLEPQE